MSLKRSIMYGACGAGLLSMQGDSSIVSQFPIFSSWKKSLINHNSFWNVTSATLAGAAKDARNDHSFSWSLCALI